MNKIVLITLLFLLLSGIFLRVYRFGSVPIGLYWDEMAMFVDAKSVATTGKDMHGNPALQPIYPSYGDYKLPVYILLSSIIFQVVSLPELVVRFPSLIAGIVTIFAAGLLSVQLLGDSSTKILKGKNKLLFLSTAVIVAISPWSFLFSRTGFEGHVGQSLLVCSVLALTFSQKNKLWLIISIVLGALATYTYFSVRFVWPVVFIAYQFLSDYKAPLEIIRAFNKKSCLIFIEQISLIAVSLLLFFLALVPMTKSSLYAESNRYRLSTESILTQDYAARSNLYVGITGTTLVDKVLFHRHYLLLRELANNYSDHFNLNFLFLSGDSNLRHGTTEHGEFLFVFLPIFLIGWYALLSKKPTMAVFLAIWWIIASLPASVPQTTPHALRSLNAFGALSVVCGFGLSEIILYLQKKGKRTYQAVVYVILASIVLAWLSFVHFYFSVYPYISAKEWQSGYKEVIAVIFEYKKEVGQTWAIVSDERFYLWGMGYGEYLGDDFLKWQTTNYHFNEFDEIRFSYRQLDIAYQIFDKIQLVTKVDDGLTWKIVEPYYTVEESRIIQSSYGGDSYRWAILKRKPNL